MFEILFPLIFMAVFFAVFVSVAKNATKNKKDSGQNNTSTNKPTLDGNGRTPEQNEYLAELRRRAAARRAEQNDMSVTQRKVATHGDNCPAEADAHAHEHVGTEEHYTPIVGSLGGESSEGCPDLDGVRLLSHDVAYDGDDGTKHFDRAKLAQAMVLGEVLNNPRFKGPHKR